MLIFWGAKSYPRFFLWGPYAMAQGVNSAMVLASGYSSRRDGFHQNGWLWGNTPVFHWWPFSEFRGPVFLLFFDLRFVFCNLIQGRKQKPKIYGIRLCNCNRTCWKIFAEHHLVNRSWSMKPLDPEGFITLLLANKHLHHSVPIPSNHPWDWYIYLHLALKSKYSCK